MITRQGPGLENDESSATAAVLGKQSDLAGHPTQRELDIEQSNNESAESYQRRRTVMISDLVDPADPEGRSYRQVNNAKKHGIPVGALVEIKWDEWFGNGMSWKVHARLRVARHTRDCDGTPLYTLSRWLPYAAETGGHHGFTEDSLKVVDCTDDSLSWKGGNRALLPHDTLPQAQREAGPLGAVAKGKDGRYRWVRIPKAEWVEMIGADREQWCAAHGFELAEEGIS